MGNDHDLVVIELNDSEIRVARDADIVLRSPGYALVGEHEIEVGEQAVRKAWLNPRATQNRYWQQLNLDPLPNPSARARHHADLAYAHLLAIHERAGKPDEVVFAVPGHYSNEQLALLLGLVEASPLTAVGLVDAAVAAAAPHVGRGEYMHAELFLHQVVLTRIDVGDEVVRGSVEVVDGAGWARLLDDCANRIADLFIEQSRFDPQHHAETEQSLFDHIPRALRALERETETTIEIAYQGATYAVKLPRAVVDEVLRSTFGRIVQKLPGDRRVLLGHRLAGLPGLVTMLNDADALPAGVQSLSADAVFAGCRAQLDRIRSTDSALDFVTRLPAAGREARAPAAESGPDAKGGTVNQDRSGTTAASVQAVPPATHVLCGDRAFPLNRGRVFLDARASRVRDGAEHAHAAAWSEDGKVSVQPLNGQRLLVNGREVESETVVWTGDRLGFAGAAAEYRFIYVQE